MADTSFLHWPFFDDHHRALAARLDAWCSEQRLGAHHHGPDVDAACRTLVQQLGTGGWLRYAVPRE